MNNILSQSKKVSRRQLAIILAVIIVGYIAGVVYSYSFTVDDSYISLRYAENLVKYGQLSFNPGESPNEGYSNFLLVLTEALFFKFGIANMVVVPKIIGIISGVLTIIFIYLLSDLAINPANAWLKYLPSLATAASTPFVVWSVSGLETTLFTFLIVAGAYLTLLSLQFNRPKHFVLADLAFFLAALTRPEGLMFWVVSYFFLAINYKSIDLKNRIKFAAVFLVIFLAYLGWKYSYFGSILPLTFYTKGAHLFALDSFKDGIIRFSYLLKINLNFVYLLLFLSAATLSLIKRNRVVNYLVLIATVYALYVFSLGYSVAMDDVFRLYVPFLPFFYVAAAAGAEYIANKLTDRRPVIPNTVIVVLMLAQIAIGTYDMNVCWNEDHNFGSRPDFAEDLHSYQTGWDDYKYFGLWLKDNMPPDSTIVIPDIGAVSYFSKLKIIDSWSLVTKEIAVLRSQQLKYPNNSPESQELNKRIVGFILDRQPEVIVMQYYEVNRYKCDARIETYKLGEMPLPSGKRLIIAVRPDMVKYFGAK